MAVAIATGFLDVSSRLGSNDIRTMLVLGGIGILLAGIFLTSRVGRQYIGTWLLIGAGATAVAIAPHLLDPRNKLKVGEPQLVLALAGFAVLTSGMVLDLKRWQRPIREWSKALTLDKQKVIESFRSLSKPLRTKNL